MTGDRTILLVDDSPWFRELGATFLARSGRVFTAASAAEAMEISRRERPNLVITDLSMPEVDGAELCALLRADEDLCDTPVVVVLGSDDPDDHARAARAGANDLLRKPLSRYALLESVSRLTAPGEHCGQPRVTIAEPVRLRFSDDAAWGTMLNVSRGGAFVEAATVIPEDHELALDFTLPGTDLLIQPTAQVMWKAPARMGSIAVGMGLRFLEIDGPSMHALEEYVFEYAQGTGLSTAWSPA